MHNRYVHEMLFFTSIIKPCTFDLLHFTYLLTLYLKIERSIINGIIRHSHLSSESTLSRKMCIEFTIFRFLALKCYHRIGSIPIWSLVDITYKLPCGPSINFHRCCVPLINQWRPFSERNASNISLPFESKNQQHWLQFFFSFRLNCAPAWSVPMVKRMSSAFVRFNHKSGAFDWHSHAKYIRNEKRLFTQFIAIL